MAVKKIWILPTPDGSVSTDARFLLAVGYDGSLFTNVTTLAIQVKIRHADKACIVKPLC